MESCRSIVMLRSIQFFQWKYFYSLLNGIGPPGVSQKGIAKANALTSICGPQDDT